MKTRSVLTLILTASLSSLVATTAAAADPKRMFSGVVPTRNLIHSDRPGPDDVLAARGVMNGDVESSSARKEQVERGEKPRPDARVP